MVTISASRSCSSQMHSSHHVKCSVAEEFPGLTLFLVGLLSFSTSSVTYLQPASLILRAYIFPMSPIPMIPTDM